MKLKHAFHHSFANGAKQLRFKEWLTSWWIKGFKIFVAIFLRENLSNVFMSVLLTVW